MGQYGKCFVITVQMCCAATLLLAFFSCLSYPALPGVDIATISINFPLTGIADAKDGIRVFAFLILTCTMLLMDFPISSASGTFKRIPNYYLRTHDNEYIFGRSYCVKNHSDWNPCDNIVPCPRNVRQCSSPCQWTIFCLCVCAVHTSSPLSSFWIYTSSPKRNSYGICQHSWASYYAHIKYGTTYITRMLLCTSHR